MLYSIYVKPVIVSRTVGSCHVTRPGSYINIVPDKLITTSCWYAKTHLSECIQLTAAQIKPLVHPVQYRHSLSLAQRYIPLDPCDAHSMTLASKSFPRSSNFLCRAESDTVSFSLLSLSMHYNDTDAKSLMNKHHTQFA